MSAPFIEPTTLIDELLAQQKSLTAAARFAQVHGQGALPAQARYYRDLIPLTAPLPGQQFAFEVDLDQCSGCKACVTACHALNGLDDDEVWRSVGLLHADGLQKTVTTACHHCVDPACLNGCPVLAYEKDSTTGIVKHLDDQCIGCGYCVMMCPYEVPKFSARRGIVRKCDMCSSRLSAGEAPACVQACPNEAIRITLVDREEVSSRFAAATGNTFLPDSPNPLLTGPTTQYRSAEPLPSVLRGADHAEVQPAQAHPPLVLFLVLTQMSVGGFLLAPLLGAASRLSASISLAAALLGLAASVAHLGQPFKSWRAFLGFRRSWLSREILAFGAFAPLAVLLTLSFWLPGPLLLRLQQLLAVTVWLTGIGGVLCSVMVYHGTRREFWSWPGTTIRFLGTSLLLGSATLLFTGAFDPGSSSPRLAALWVIAGAAGKFLFEALESGRFRPAVASRRFFSHPQLSRTARLLDGPLRPIFSARLLTLLVGGLVLPALSFIPHSGVGLGFAALVLLLASEFLERHLFFTAVSPDRMPGLPNLPKP